MTDEQKNAAPQDSEKPIASRETSQDELAGYKSPGERDSPVPAGAAPAPTPLTDAEEFDVGLVVENEHPQSVVLSDFARLLEHALTAAKEELKLAIDGAGRFMVRLQAAEAALAEKDAEIARLREDAERLDWLETGDDRFYNIDRITSRVNAGFNGHPTLREAIDAAKEVKP